MKDIKDLNTSSETFRRMVLDPNQKSSHDELTVSPGSFVDSRDLAQAHVLATTIPEAGNERFMISSGAFSWQEFRECPSIQPISLFRC